MRHRVSKYTSICRTDPSLPPRLSYWSDNTPSSQQLFPVNICTVRRRSSNLFCHIRRPKSLLLPSRISSIAVFIHVVPHLHHHDNLSLYSPLTLSANSIIPHLHRTYIVILPRLCCGPHHIIFHHSVYFSAIVCLPSRIGYSTRSALFCTTLIALLFYTLPLSLSALIFSLKFYLLFWNGSFLSP